MLLNVVGIQFLLTPMQKKHEELINERTQIVDELAQQQLMIDMLDARIRIMRIWWFSCRSGRPLCAAEVF